METMSWKQKTPLLVAVPVVFGLGAITAMGLRGNAGAQNNKPPVQPGTQVVEMQNAFEQVAETLRPSIVFIRAKQAAPAQGEGGDNPFHFPGVPEGDGQDNPFGRIPRNFQMPRQRATASGSGVIVRSDGYILTNDHVVQGADKVVVRLQDGREFTGQVKRDFRSDLALIKVEATGLPAAQLADSDKVKIGQWAVAFGSPFGLSDTMTLGIISSLHRNQQIGFGTNGRYYPSLIQTDASINPGNSGGPLVDMYGRVVGINVAIESPTGGSVGIGFAIPTNTAKFVMEQLIAKGAVTRGYLGLAPKALTFEDQKRYNLTKGVLVTQVQEGTPAAKAGFQVEDVIVRFNNKPIESEIDFRDVVARTSPGTSVPVTVKRGGEEKSLSVTLGTMDDKKTAQANPTQKAETKGKLGLMVGDTTDPEVREKLKLDASAKPAAVIMEVVDGSPASEAGLLKGDIIEKIDGKNTANAEAVTSMVKALPAGKSVNMVIRRGDQHLLVNIDLE